VNILFIDQFSDPGGAQRCLMDLMPEVQRRGWIPHLMTPGKGELPDWCRRSAISVYQLPLRPFSNGAQTTLDLLRFSFDVPRMAAAIRRVIAGNRIDMVYVNGPRVLPAVAGFTHLPVVFHAHSLVRKVYASKIADRSLRLARATVIAASKFVARSHRNARVIYNGVADLWLGARSFGGRPARIAIIGRIAPEKGHLDFVRAARLVRGDLSGAQFLVYGAPLFSDPRYENAVRAEAQGAPVRFCGWTSNVATALRDLDVLVVPSGPSEAATRVIIEAFSAGTPVLAYGSGGIPELIEDGRTGVLTTSPDPEALARGIRLLIADPAKLERLSIAGRGEWDARFRIETFRENICALLESTLTDYRGARATTAARHERRSATHGRDK
jgi:glycosyltransferase involved in cell wall biosynthesis